MFVASISPCAGTAVRAVADSSRFAGLWSRAAYLPEINFPAGQAGSAASWRRAGARQGALCVAAAGPKGEPGLCPPVAVPARSPGGGSPPAAPGWGLRGAARRASSSCVRRGGALLFVRLRGSGRGTFKAWNNSHGCYFAETV